jgi:hypothetical protein
MEEILLMGLTNWLASISGGRLEILSDTPGDRIRYAAMGGVILTTATVAAVSGAIAVNMALRLSPLWSMLVGLLWGLVIFNLDRLLVTQMARNRNGIKQPILLTLPRLVLAVILGFVISTPMVLSIFNAEIQDELGVIHQQELNAYTTQVDATTYKNIPTLTAQLNGAQQVVDSGTVPSVDDDPDVKAAEARFVTAENAYQKAEANVVCEKEGICGSRTPGAGIAYGEKVTIRDDAKSERDAAQKAVNQARTSATTRLNTAAASTLSNAQSTVGADTADLATLTAQRKVDLADQKKKIDSDNGLLARLEALSELSATRPTLEVTHWVLFALFLSLEVLPVLTKLLQVLGPETTYDKLATASDAATRRVHRQSNATRLKIHRAQLAVEKRLERDRARRALAAGRKYNSKLVKTQQAVISAALDAWSQHARDSTRQALADWEQQLASSRPPSARQFVKPVNIPMPLGPESFANGRSTGQANFNGRGGFQARIDSGSSKQMYRRDSSQHQSTSPTQSIPSDLSVTQEPHQPARPRHPEGEPVNPRLDSVGSAFGPVEPDFDAVFDQVSVKGQPAVLPSTRHPNSDSGGIDLREGQPDQEQVLDWAREEPPVTSRPGRHAYQADGQEVDREPDYENSARTHLDQRSDEERR